VGCFVGALTRLSLERIPTGTCRAFKESKQGFGTVLARMHCSSDFIIGGTFMKWFLATAFAATLSMASVVGADAKGCIKGAIVGGVVGHMAGHGKLGAAAGCAIGHHEASKPDPKNANAQAPAQK
jgi:hypothetical protein